MKKLSQSKYLVECGVLPHGASSKRKELGNEVFSNSYQNINFKFTFDFSNIIGEEDKVPTGIIEYALKTLIISEQSTIRSAAAGNTFDESYESMKKLKRERTIKVVPPTEKKTSEKTRVKEELKTVKQLDESRRDLITRILKSKLSSVAKNKLVNAAVSAENLDSIYKVEADFQNMNKS